MATTNSQGEFSFYTYFYMSIGCILLIFTLVIGCFFYFEIKASRENTITNRFDEAFITFEHTMAEKVEPLLNIAFSGASFPPSAEMGISPNRIVTSNFFRNNIKVIQFFEDIYSIGYAFNSGEFIFLVDTRILDRHTSNFNYPSNASYALVYKLSSKTSDPVQVHFYDEELNDILLTSYFSSYNPSLSPWYKETISAGKTQFFPYSNFATMKEKGFITASPFENNSGVYFITSAISFVTDSLAYQLDELSASMYILDGVNVLGSYVNAGDKELHGACLGEVRAEDKSILLSKADYLSSRCSFSKVITKLVEQSDNNPISSSSYFTQNNQDIYYKVGKIKMADKDLDLVLLITDSNIKTVLPTPFNALIIFASLLVLACLGISYNIIRKIQTPLSELSNNLSIISDDDLHSTKKMQTKFIEINKLDENINNLKNQLERNILELSNSNKELHDELEFKGKCLDEAIVIANESLNVKTLFANEISRELRGHIHGVLGFSYIFEKNQLSDIQKQQVDIVHFSANSLLQLTNYIADYSNLNHDNVKFDNIPFLLDALIQNIGEYFDSVSSFKDLQLEILKEDNLPATIIGDPPRVFQVIQSLIDNAIEVTERNCKITFEIKRIEALNNTVGKKLNTENLAIAFVIKDCSQVVITQEEVKNLLLPFTASVSHTNYSYKGSRLGFDVTKWLVAEMGGEITIQPKVDGGNEFIIKLMFEVPEYSNMAADETPAEINQNIYVLVVDDNQVNLEVSKALFRKMNIKVDAVQSGREALEKIKTNNYDLIFLDIQMPEMDGYEVCNKMRNIVNPDEYATDTRVIPIIAMTANALPEDYIKCLEAGMNERIVKPIAPDRLYKLVQAWLTHSFHRVKM